MTLSERDQELVLAYQKIVNRAGAAIGNYSDEDLLRMLWLVASGYCEYSASHVSLIEGYINCSKVSNRA